MAFSRSSSLRHSVWKWLLGKRWQNKPVEDTVELLLVIWDEELNTNFRLKGQVMKNAGNLSQASQSASTDREVFLPCWNKTQRTQTGNRSVRPSWRLPTMLHSSSEQFRSYFAVLHMLFNRLQSQKQKSPEEHSALRLPPETCATIHHFRWGNSS